MHKKYVLRFSDNRGPAISWSETIKKEARSLEGLDLGEVQEIGMDHVRTAKGLLNRRSYYLPRNLAEAFDGSTLWFRIPPRQREEASWASVRLTDL